MADTGATFSAHGAEMLNLASSIVAAYISNNPVPAGELPSLIRDVYRTLTGLAGGGRDEATTSQRPAVPIKKSITPGHIVCLEDGKKLTMLKRYLRGNYNLTPEQYRAKWGLPRDYPMVAPNYSAQRSEFAKNIGLGHTRAKTSPKRKRA